MSLRTDRKCVRPCTIGVSKLGQRGAKDFHRLLEQHRLVAANTWSVRKPATHIQGNSVSQIDYVQLRQSQTQGPVALHVASLLLQVGEKAAAVFR